MPLSRAQDGTIASSVYYDYAGRTGSFENGFPWASYIDSDPECSENGGERYRGSPLDMDHIDYNDKQGAGIPWHRTVQMVCSSWKVRGMKNFMKELKPQSLEDVIAGISLYRPGPMDFIPQYIRGQEPSGYHYAMTARSWSRSWSPTYGCIVYQEQVMQIVRNLAGYTLGTK